MTCMQTAVDTMDIDSVYTSFVSLLGGRILHVHMYPLACRSVIIFVMRTLVDSESITLVLDVATVIFLFHLLCSVS